MDSSKKAILETLIYSDIFDYPLSEGEIWKFLHADKKIKKKSFIKKVKEINSVVEHEKDMLFLKGKRKSVIRRIEREKESLQKIEYAKKIIKKIFLVPTVLFVGISGSLSVLNASKNDDIDLFIIARKNTVWASRFFVILLLKFLGVHRRRGGKDIKNKFCLNMIIDESSLKFSKAKQDLYTAHEIAQVLPIIERGQTYSRFINSNLWIKKHLPNILEDVKNRKFEGRAKIPLPVSVLENIFKWPQSFFIKRNRTTETVRDHFLAFHPRDYRTRTMLTYNGKLIKHGLFPQKN